MTRRKMNVLDMIRWKVYVPHNCSFCGKKATGVLTANTWFRFRGRDLCDDCTIKWVKGDLYI